MAQGNRGEEGSMTTEEAGRKSWTANPSSSNVPGLTDEDRRRERDLRAKQERGETLTTEEAGFLGGVTRVRQARGESNDGR